MNKDIEGIWAASYMTMIVMCLIFDGAIILGACQGNAEYVWRDLASFPGYAVSLVFILGHIFLIIEFNKFKKYMREL